MNTLHHIEYICSHINTFPEKYNGITAVFKISEDRSHGNFDILLDIYSKEKTGVVLRESTRNCGDYDKDLIMATTRMLEGLIIAASKVPFILETETISQ